MAITVGLLGLGETPHASPKGQSKHLQEGVKKRDKGVMLAAFHRVWPLAGLTLALVATVSWIGLLGYVAIKLL
jgi:hypothetical protein